MGSLCTVSGMLGVAFPSVLVAAQQGAAWALTRLWEDLGPLVAGYLRTQGARDPDDLTSETFIGVFKAIAGFTGDERSFRSWVLVIAHRRLLDERRRHTRRPENAVQASVLADVAGGDAETDAMDAVQQGAVREALATLSDDQRAVLTLRIMGEFTVDEVACIVGKRPGAVKALQRRGLVRLRTILSEEGALL